MRYPRDPLGRFVPYRRVVVGTTNPTRYDCYYSLWFVV